jgi:hypothetical protein
MEIYQCMTDGERWTHGGLQAGADEATRHQDLGHVVLIGDIDKLAQALRHYPDQAPLVPEGPDPERPELPIGGKVETWGPDPVSETPPATELFDNVGRAVVTAWWRWLATREDKFSVEVAARLDPDAFLQLAKMIAEAY